jgi:hypothetical protein
MKKILKVSTELKIPITLTKNKKLNCENEANQFNWI